MKFLSSFCNTTPPPAAQCPWKLDLEITVKSVNSARNECPSEKTVNSKHEDKEELNKPVVMRQRDSRIKMDLVAADEPSGSRTPLASINPKAQEKYIRGVSPLH